MMAVVNMATCDLGVVYIYIYIYIYIVDMEPRF